MNERERERVCVSVCVGTDASDRERKKCIVEYVGGEFCRGRTCASPDRIWHKLLREGAEVGVGSCVVGSCSELETFSKRVSGKLCSCSCSRHLGYIWSNNNRWKP